MRDTLSRQIPEGLYDATPPIAEAAPQGIQPVLPELFDTLNKSCDFDETDWTFAIRFAERWKLSVADALLDLNFLDETSLAKALAVANNLAYLPGTELETDFSDISFDDYDDLSSVGAAPLTENRLAICNPYDDLHGYLGNRICERELVVTERSALYEALRTQGLESWLDQP